MESNNVVAKVFEAWASNWMPLSSTPPPYGEMQGVTLKTTEDIVDELSDMVDTDAATVASLMAAAGFSIIFLPNGRHGWAMVPRQR